MSNDKQAALAIFNHIEESRQFTGYYDRLSIPPTPKGNQRLSAAPKAGAKVEMLQFATMRGTAKVKETYEQNGFVYVVTDKCGTQRLQDVKVID